MTTRRVLLPTLLLLAPNPSGHAADRSFDAPFTIEATEDVSSEFPGAPRLQSFAWAQWQGKWIFLAGRTGGYHGVGQGDVDFPRARANTKIWVIDPATSPAKTYSYAVADLPANLNAVKDQWVSSNLQHYQDGETLYLAGGYGQNSAGDVVTYAVLSSVHLPSLVNGVISGKDTFSKTIAWVESPHVKATGGELVKLDDGLFYLVGGHEFMGTYRAFEAQGEKNTAKVYQRYLGEIRQLKIQPDGPGKLSVTLVRADRDPEFARRDLNVALTMMPDGKLGATAYGGVFTKEQLNFTRPIYITGHDAPQVDQTFEQKLSAYSCAKLLMFDPDARQMYTTFFGGISRYLWNYRSHTFEAAPLPGERNSATSYYDGTAWIDHISTLVRGPQGTAEIVQSAQRLPGYVGTNAAFLPADGLTKAHPNTSILDFRQFRGKRVFVGYTYGGIRANARQFPYTDAAPSYSSGNVPTKTSDMILKVYVTVPAAS